MASMRLSRTGPVWICIGFAGFASAAQMTWHFAFERSSKVNVDHLVNRFGAHTHLWRVGEILAYAMADLFGRPPHSQFLTHILTKPVVRDQL